TRARPWWRAVPVKPWNTTSRSCTVTACGRRSIRTKSNRFVEPFRSMRGGGVKAVLAAAEASLLRSLVSQIQDLIEPDAAKATDLDELEALLQADAAQTPSDPVLARLLPDGYRDDPDSAGEFRKYTELALRAAKHENAQLMLDSLPEDGGKLQLTAEQ